MKTLIEEYGAILIHSIVGIIIIGIGAGMFIAIRPYINIYLTGLM